MTILTQKQARKLQNPMTIDLREIQAKEYIESKKSLFLKIIENIMKYIGIAGVIWFVIVLFFGWGILRPEIGNANLAWDQDTSITYDKLVTHSSMKPPREIYKKLKKECYEQNASDKLHCIKVGLSIAYAESSWKDQHTPFGLQSKEKGYSKWVRSYNKYWYTAKDGFFFYGDWGVLGRSHYCTSEESSGSSLGCPNGRRNFQNTFDSLRIQ